MKFDERYEIARPYTAAFVILRKESKIAMVLRKNTGYFDGHYGLPAGKGEWHETLSTVAAREALEEAGVTIERDALKMVHFVHRRDSNAVDLFMDWIDVYFEADSWEGEPYNAEPEKSERLDWLDVNNLPENIVPGQRAALLEIVKGNFYSEFGWDDEPAATV